MPFELRDGDGGIPNVQDDHFAGVHENSSHEAGILLVPAEPQQGRVWLRALVDDGRVLLVAQVENPHGSVRRHGRKDAGTAPRDVVNLLVVRDELRVDNALLDVPDCARRVDAARAQPLQVGLVPVERREWGAVVAVQLAVQQTLGLHAVLVDLPDAEGVARGRQQVRLRALLVGDEHDFGGGVRVVK